MNFKRFFQLFICYALSIAAGFGAVVLFSSAAFWVKAVLFIIVGYLVLCLPLTLLTLMKSKTN